VDKNTERMSVGKGRQPSSSHYKPKSTAFRPGKENLKIKP